MHKMMTDQALDYLNNDLLLHIDMIENIRRGSADVVSASDRGALLFSQPCGAWMISADDLCSFEALLSVVDIGDTFVVHQSFAVDVIKSRFSLEVTMPCTQVARLDRSLLPETGERCDIRPLGLENLDFVQTHYSHKLDREYLAERLTAGVIAGAFINGELAGFIGEHSEGSLGMLEVLPAYRRRGIAEALERHAVNRHLRAGYTPFAQIKQGNQASLDLQSKLGFVFADQPIFWVY